MRYIIWDFDGTLAYRPGKWSGALLTILRREVPEYQGSVEEIRQYLRDGFPWHKPDKVRQANQPADVWWDTVLPVFERVFQGVAGLSVSESRRLAREVRRIYTDTTDWRLFEDTIPCLETLSNRGWEHFILSNHVPELKDIVEALGLSCYFTDVFSSATIGVEKPHPKAFYRVLDCIPSEATNIWMVGDNPAADVVGARTVGLKAVLVRNTDPSVDRSCRTLTELPRLIEGP